MIGFKNNSFDLVTPHTPTGDQPSAIKKLVEGLNNGEAYQTLLGATGTGKTFTMANVITQTNRPALIIAPNKTLCAQLYAEMKAFFPNAAVEYFVSYFDYFQPETYIPSIDRYIDKDSKVNSYLQMLRLSATSAIMSRQDTIIIATVSAIYGLGEKWDFETAAILFEKNIQMSMKEVCLKLSLAMYENKSYDTFLSQGEYKKNGDTMVIYPADVESFHLRVSFFDDVIEKIDKIDPITGKVTESLSSFILFPASHYVFSQDTIISAIEKIKKELDVRHKELLKLEKPFEAARLKQKVMFDLEMLITTGHCKGLENYSRHFTGRTEGEPPSTLIDYLPKDAIVFIDESHTTIPQMNGMYAGDKSRKDILIQYGFRLPSAYDARPLKFCEIEQRLGQTIFVSATPSKYEVEKSGTSIAQQVIRPTGIVDPIIEVRPVNTMVDDCMSEVKKRAAVGERVLVTVLSKVLAENTAEYFNEHGLRARYLHGDVEAMERVEILRDLRQGVFDVLVGINLLREGLDLPEVSLVCIMDADKEGFLRNARTLIQTTGRAARNINGHAIFYADKMTDSMKNAIEETDRRRKIQSDYNDKNNITPKNIAAQVSKFSQIADPIAEILDEIEDDNISKALRDMEKRMKQASKDLRFEDAAKLRDQISMIRKRTIGHE